MENSGDNLVVHRKDDTRLVMKPFRTAVAKCLEMIGQDCTFENFKRVDKEGETNWFRWSEEIDLAKLSRSKRAMPISGTIAPGWQELLEKPYKENRMDAQTKIPRGRVTDLATESIIIPADGNPRQSFDETLLFSLGESMTENSQLQPIIVNRTDGKNYLVAGERRLKAAIKAGVEFIEAKVFMGLDAVTVLKMRLAENRDRVQLDVIEQARGMQQLAEHSMCEKDIAKLEGCSTDTVRKRLSLLKLAVDVQRLMTRENNPLPVHQALILKNLPTSDQIQIARKAAPVTGKVASEEQVREWVSETVGGQLAFGDPPETGSGESAPAGGGRQGNTLQRAVTKDQPPAEKVKAVSGAVGVTGKIDVLAGTEEDIILRIKKATITFKVGDDVQIFSCDTMTLDIGPENTAKVGKMIKKGQPKPKNAPAKTTAKKKATAKKKTTTKKKTATKKAKKKTARRKDK